MAKEMKGSKANLVLMYLLSLIIGAGIYINTFMSSWAPADGIVILSIFLCLFVDQYIMRFYANLFFSKFQFSIFFLVALLFWASQFQSIWTYFSITENISSYYFSIGVGMLTIFVWQLRLFAKIVPTSPVSRSILTLVNYSSLSVSVMIIVNSFNFRSLEVLHFIPSQESLLLFFYLVLAVQAVVIGAYIYSEWQEQNEVKSLTNSEFGIWNIAGFVKNTENIRRICARLDQDVTLALFRIGRYSDFRDNMSNLEFKAFVKSFTRWLKFSLRRHDQFALIDENIYAVLLPFTNLDKGEIACLRLQDHVNREIISENLLLPSEFSMSFGLTLVNKEEKNIIPALKRAAVALSRAEPAFVEKYSSKDTPIETYAK